MEVYSFRYRTERAVRHGDCLQACSSSNPHARRLLQVTLGALPSIGPSLSDTCADGDGTSLTLLAGVIRTDVSGRVGVGATEQRLDEAVGGRIPALWSQSRCC